MFYIALYRKTVIFMYIALYILSGEVLLPGARFVNKIDKLLDENTIVLL